MPRGPADEGEPAPLAEDVSFEEGDFYALSPACEADPQYNDRRLLARRKLLALAKTLAARVTKAGVRLDPRTSLHHPHAFNGMRVRRLWAYLTRPSAERKRLQRVLGAELAKDLDAAYRNAYLCLAIEPEHLEVSLRIHQDAWYDGQNLVRRVGREGPGEWLALLNELRGFRLRLHDWKGEWICGELDGDRLREFLKYYVPGEHSLSVEQRIPAPRGAREHVLAPDVPARMVAEAERLLPLYRFMAWSKESDYLFG